MIVSIALLALAFLPQTPDAIAQASDATAPPAGARLALTAEGLGVQSYHCTPEPGGTFKWVFDSVDATLFDPTTRQPVGKLSTGPVWRWNDGSEIAGKVLETAPANDPANIPSLLFATHSTGASTGALAAITLARRANTQAGAAPSYGCYAAKANNIIHVPYEATYTFYTTKQ